MQPINKQDVLIRLLKDGHINNEEFKALYEPIDVVRNGFWQPVEPYPNVTAPTFRHQYVPEWSPICTSSDGNQITCGTGGSKIGSKELEKDSNGIELLDPLTKEEIESMSKTFQESIKDMDKMKKAPFPFKDKKP